MSVHHWVHTTQRTGSDKTLIPKDTCTPMFIAALYTIAKTWKQTKCSSTEERIKMWYIYTLEYYSAIKKEWDISICSNMDTTRDTVLSEVKSEGESTMWYHLYVESKVWHEWIYLRDRNRLRDIENRFMASKGKGVEGGLEWETGVSRCKLLYME